ncbi:telomeric repeat binding factor 1 [Cricetulus griseus]
MAAAVASEARNSRACANRKDADSPEEEMKEPPGDDAELVAEAEAVAAGWMLDFLCLSLCRAFRDGRSEDFRRTRDSAEGECGPRTAEGAAPRAEACFPHTWGAFTGARLPHHPGRANPAASC